MKVVVCCAVSWKADFTFYVPRGDRFGIAEGFVTTELSGNLLLKTDYGVAPTD